MDLHKVQVDLHRWRQRNFPDADADQQFMGVVEEVGELAHALLKQKQKIRGDYQLHENEAQDAVGDIVVYLMGLCSYRGWNFEDIFQDTVKIVMRRDWITNPVSGGVDTRAMDLLREDDSPIQKKGGPSDWSELGKR